MIFGWPPAPNCPLALSLPTPCPFLPAATLPDLHTRLVSLHLGLLSSLTPPHRPPPPCYPAGGVWGVLGADLASDTWPRAGAAATVSSSALSLGRREGEAGTWFQSPLLRCGSSSQTCLLSLRYQLLHCFG